MSQKGAVRRPHCSEFVPGMGSISQEKEAPPERRRQPRLAAPRFWKYPVLGKAAMKPECHKKGLFDDRIAQNLCPGWEVFLKKKRRRLKGGGSQDWLPHGFGNIRFWGRLPWSRNVTKGAVRRSKNVADCARDGKYFSRK